tara:strand:+ start:206 stop:910 length:705 start_codon:yes stop_codon:yes gene_type:complete
MKIKHRLFGYIVLAVIIIGISILPLFLDVFQNFSSPEYIRTLLIDAGIFGYGLLVLLLLGSIPLPIPSTPIILGGGYVYGLVIGSIVSLIGILIGASISFLLVRRFGRPLLKKLVDEHHMKHFNHVFKRRGKVAVILSYAIPIFPSDAVSLLLGLTKMRYTTFITLVILGHIPRVLLINSLGSDLYTGFTINSLFVVLGNSVFVLIAIFRKVLKKFFFKELRELGDEVSKVTLM